MQITIPRETVKTFRPVTVSITFDTAEEIQRWCNMLGYNLSIPEVVYDKKSKDLQAILKTELDSLRTQIVEAHALLNQ